VDRQAETAFKASDMVLEEVGVLIEVDRLKGELAKTLATVCVRCGVRCNTTATELGSCAVLKERDQIKPKKVDIHATHAYLVIHLESRPPKSEN
jgi:hypothetical protein